MHGFGKLLGRNLDAISTLCVPAWIVRRAPFASGAIEGCELRRTDAPVTALLPRHDMEMEVRCFLSAEDSVVLEREDSEGLIGFDEGFGDSLGRNHDGSALLLREIEQCRDVSTCDDAALADLELPRVDHGECVLGFFYDLPFFLADCHAKVAWVFYGEFDHLLSLVMLACQGELTTKSTAVGGIRLG